MGGKTATTTQAVQIPPEVLARYNAVNAQAQAAAAQPFQAYGGQFVAPLTATQQAGIAATYGAAGAAEPYYQAAAGLTAAGAGPVMPEELQTQRYMNPFTQNVVEATQRALQQQQGQQRSQQQAEAIRGGAYGGDRSGIQRAVLQGQQGLATAQAISPLYQQGYSQALQTAQQQQGVGLQAQQANLQRALAAGQQFGALGTGAQQAGLAGAQALLGAGTLQQQTQQADLTARYQQFLQERGYPFQVAQFLANIAMGTGALSGSTTTTQQAAPFFSDEREKTNIKKLGKGLYAYDYKDDVEAARREGRPMPPKRVGPMAQDIEKKKPGLVIDINDYKVVDPSRDSMGGAVMEPGAYERGGYAVGGLAPEDLRSIIQAQAQFLGPYGGQGGPYGGQKQGQPGFVPQASLPVAKLVTAGAVPQQSPSGFQQIMRGAEQTQGLGETLIGDKGLFAEKGLAGKAISGVESLGRKLGLGSASPAAAPLPAQVPETDKSKDTSSQQDITKNARGGLIPHHYADGGMPYGGDPILADVLQEGKNEIRQLPTPGQAPGAPKGLGSEIMDAAKLGSSLYGLGSTAASGLSSLSKFLPMLLLKDGGLVPRTGFQEGGSETGMPSDDELAIRTMLSEAGRGRRGEINPQEALGIGAVIVNRAKSRGLSPGDVVLQRGQFEPWARPGGDNDPMKWDTSSPAYRQMAEYWARAKAGEDPTGGATHFYGPASQAALGRAAPSWASAPGLQFGATSFHRGEDIPDGQPRQTPMLYNAVPAQRGQPEEGGLGAVPAQRGQPEEGGLGAVARAILPTTRSATGEENINWKQTLIPILSGLGAMASSPSRYLGSAILQGIGKGAESYANLEKQQADIAQTQELTRTQQGETARRWLNAAKEAMYKGADGEAYVLTAKGPVRLNVYNLDPARYGEPLAGAQARRAIEQIPGATPITPDVFGPYKPKIEPPGAPTSQQPSEGQPPAGAPSTGAPAPGQPITPIHVSAENPRIIPGRPNPYTLLGNSSKNYLSNDTNAFVLNPSAMASQKTISDDVERKIISAGVASTDVNAQLNQLATKILSLPESGLSAPGPTNPAGVAIQTYANEVMKIFNIPKDFWLNPQDVGTNEAARKISGALQMARGSQSVEALKTALSVIPHASMTRDGIVQVLASSKADVQRDIDRARYLRDYIQEARNRMPTNPNYYLAQNAERAFVDDNPSSQYSIDQKKMEALMRTINPRTGKPIWLDYYGPNKVPSYYSDRAVGRVGFRRYIENQ